MTDTAPCEGTTPKPFFIAIGSLLAIAYWFIEAYFDSVLIEDTSFAARLLPSDPNELWMRSLISLLFVGFGFYAHRTYLRIKAAEQLSIDAAWLLKNALAHTIRGRFPICVFCKNIRDEDDQWLTPDKFISAQTEAEFSHAVCDRCRSTQRAAARCGEADHSL